LEGDVTWGRRRERGYPTSSNGASSFHLRWQDVPPSDSVEVSIRVDFEPEVDRLCFWALQTSFSDAGRHTGGAHLGLQWNPRYPGYRAVNWGGYHTGGEILSGTESPLRSTPNDPNTRDLWWEPGTTYRLRVTPAGPGWWAGSIEDDHGNVVEVRKLNGGGTRLEAPIVWSEIFTRCGASSVSVTWSDPSYHIGGVVHGPTHYSVNYQAVARGGCTNTCSNPVQGGVRQTTNTRRTVRQGAVIPVRSE
jgi:hypothetical protein